MVNAPIEYKLRGACFMRLSELCSKEIINLENGEKMGNSGYIDLIFDEQSGKIEYILVPGKFRFLSFGIKNYIQIPWESIKRIGPDIIIIETERQIYGNK